MADMAFDLNGVSVCIGIPVGRPMECEFVKSLLDTTLALQSKGILFDVQMSRGVLVEANRTKICYDFLNGPCTRLFMIDSDMSWQPKDFMRLLALSTKLPCVSAIYPAKLERPTFLISADETVECNEYGCLEVRGLGLGFTVVWREVIQALSDKAPKLIFPWSEQPVPHIFRCDSLDGVFRGEDIAFFADVRDLGHKVNLDKEISLGHVGNKEYRGNFKGTLQETSEASRQSIVNPNAEFQAICKTA